MLKRLIAPVLAIVCGVAGLAVPATADSARAKLGYEDRLSCPGDSVRLADWSTVNPARGALGEGKPFSAAGEVAGLSATGLVRAPKDLRRHEWGVVPTAGFAGAERLDPRFAGQVLALPAPGRSAYDLSFSFDKPQRVFFTVTGLEDPSRAVEVSGDGGVPEVIARADEEGVRAERTKTGMRARPAEQPVQGAYDPRNAADVVFDKPIRALTVRVQGTGVQGAPGFVQLSALRTCPPPKDPAKPTQPVKPGSSATPAKPSAPSRIATARPSRPAVPTQRRAVRRAAPVCTNEAYLTNAAGDLYRVDPATRKTELIKAGTGLASFGYNRADGQLWGWPTTQTNPPVLRVVDPKTGDGQNVPIAADGSGKNVSSSTAVNGASVSMDGTKLYFGNDGSGFNVIDLSAPATPKFERSFSGSGTTARSRDIAVSPLDGWLYEVSDTDTGRVVRVNPQTGAGESLGTTQNTSSYYHGLFFDAAGSLYAVDANGAGAVLKIDLGYDPAQGKAKMNGWRKTGDLSPAVATGDAAACFDPVDYGDAPAGYGEAGHKISSGLGLGATIDAEAGNQPSADATGDDNAGVNDEDAFTAPPSIVAGAKTASFEIPVKNTTGAKATLAGWIDLNKDTVFQDGERTKTTVNDKEAKATLEWTSLPDLTRGTTMMRLRLLAGDQADPEPATMADGGEAEDHELHIGGEDRKVCSNTVYVSGAAAGQPTRLYRQNLVTGAREEIALTLNGAASAVRFDALAYNSGDGLLYAARTDSTGKLISIAPATGVIEELTVRPNAANQALPSAAYDKGAITPDGKTYHLGASGSNLVSVDVDTTRGDTPRFLKSGASSASSFLDMAVNPADGRLYTLSGNTLYRWADSDSGSYTNLGALSTSGTYNGAVFDSLGNLYLIEQSGNAVQVDLTKLGSGNLAVRGKDFIVGKSQAIQNSDAAGCLAAQDFGDAPDAYETGLGDDGPRHGVTGKLGLGADTDAEPDAVGARDLIGDDVTNRNDEDAITADPLIPFGTDAPSVEVTVRNTTGEAATLAGWLDVDLDEKLDPGERATVAVPDAATKVSLAWQGFKGKYSGKRGPALLRLRLFPGDVADPAPTGPADAGEVEDQRAFVGGEDKKTCDDTVYVSAAAGANDPTNLYRQALATGARTEIPLTYAGGASTVRFNALAYNSGDGLLYAARTDQPGKLITIDPEDGTIRDIPVSGALPSTAYYRGGISPDGRFFYLAGSGSAPLVTVEIDVSKGDTPKYVRSGVSDSSSDWAVNPIDGKIWAMASNNSLYWFEPSTGRATSAGTVSNGTSYNGGLVFDNVGNLYKVDDTGKTIQIDLTELGTGNVAKRGKDWVVGQSKALAGGGAAGCLTARDFGSAPDSYKTKLEDGGPRHVVTKDLLIGAKVQARPDADNSMWSDINAVPDGTDGLATPPLIAYDTDAPTVEAAVKNGTGKEATLAGWLDVNLNGRFDDFERAAVEVADGADKATLTWSGLKGKYTGKRGVGALRLRLFPGDAANPGPVGEAAGGEVEDHRAFVGGAAKQVCDGRMYVSGAPNDEATRLFAVSPATGRRTEIKLTVGGKSSKMIFNGLAYNPADGLLYAARRDQPGKLITIDPASGAVFDLPVFPSPAGTALPAQNYQAGAISPDGKTYYLAAGSTAQIVNIDVTRGDTPRYVKPGTTIGNYQDFAVHPLDGRLYSAYLAQAKRWNDPETGTSTTVPGTIPDAGTVTGAVFDTAGNLYVVNTAGGIFQLDLTKLDGGNLATVGGGKQLGTMAVPANADAAGCLIAQQFGSAPDSYKTMLTEDGPRNELTPGLRLGTTVTAGPDGDPSGWPDISKLPNGTGALTAEPSLPYDTGTLSLDVAVQNTTGKPATLAGWIDVNLDGKFEDAERVTVAVPDGADKVKLDWTGLGGKYSGKRGIGAVRLRLFPAGVADFKATGAVQGGGVADYRLFVGGADRKQCNDIAYVSGAASGQPTKLYRQGLTSAARTEVPLTYDGAESTIQFNALAYNPAEGKLYAARTESGQQGKLISIAPGTGVVSDVALFPNAASGRLPAAGYSQGAISADGKTYYLRAAGGAIQTVTVDPAKPDGPAFVSTGTSGTALADFAVNPVDGKLYGASGTTLYKVEPGGATAGAGTLSNSVTNPRAVFDASGNLYLLSDDGRIVQIDLSKPAKGKDNLVGNAQPFPAGDGAGCFRAWDYGDAPDSYKTRQENDPARHQVTGKLRLGADLDANPNADSLAPLNGFNDDLNDGRDDEDGTAPLKVIKTTDTSYSVDTAAHNDTGADATLAGWIDFNGDGAFSDGERATATVGQGDTTPKLTWTTLPGLKAGVTFLRLRLFPGAAGDAKAGGSADAGEVEDHRLAVRAGPETCPNTVYVSGAVGSGSPTTLYEQNLTTGARSEIPLTYQDKPSTVRFNALAYNPGDGLLYAARTDQAGKLVLIDPGMGTITDLDVQPNGTQKLAAHTFTAGAISTDGKTYFLSQQASSGFNVQLVDLSDLSAPKFRGAWSSGLNFADYAENPVDGRLYGGGSTLWRVGDAAGADAKNLGTLPTSLTNPGAVFDNLGYLYLIGENGVIVEADLTTKGSDGKAVLGKMAVVGKPSALGNSDAAGCVVAQDFGDAPDSYRTKLADAGPSHVIVPGLMLGKDVDAEPGADSQKVLDGTNDDVNIRPDEDGLTSVSIGADGKLALDVEVANSTGKGATLAAWVDLDGDGLFSTAERETTTVADGAKDAKLGFAKPTGKGAIYTRLRLYPGTVADPTPGGPAPGGEIEDHRLGTANLKITQTGYSTALPAGTSQRYVLTVTNEGPGTATGAKVLDMLAAEYSGVTWSCAGAGGATCGAGTGSGNALNATVNLPPGGTITLTVTAPTKAADKGKKVTNIAEVRPPTGAIDLDLTDNTTETETTLTDPMSCRSGFDLCINTDGPPKKETLMTASGGCGSYVNNNKQFYSDTSCNMTLLVDGTTRYGSANSDKAQTLLEKGSMSGAGTAADPYTIYQRWQAGDSGIDYQVTNTYVTGKSQNRTAIQLTNNGTAEKKIRFYVYADCYLAGDDKGYSAVTMLSEGRRAPACIGAGSSAAGQVEQFIPATPDNEYYVGAYGSYTSGVTSKGPLQNTVNGGSSYQDNAMAIAWEITISAGETKTLEYDTLITQPGEPRISLVATARPTEAVEGKATEVMYTITARSETPLDVVPDELSFALPAGFTYVPGSMGGDLADEPAVNGTTLTSPAPFEIAGEEEKTFTLKAAIGTSVRPGTYAGTATGKLGSYLVGPPKGRPDAHKANVKINPRPPVEIEKTSDPESGNLAYGAPVTYTVTLQNNGSSVRTGYTFTDDLTDVLDDANLVEPLATGLTYDQATRKLTWKGDLPTGAKTTVTYKVVAKDPPETLGDGTLTNAVIGSTDSNCAAGKATAECAGTPLKVVKPDVRVVKTSSPATGDLPPGSEVTYTVTLTSASDKKAAATRSGGSGASFTDDLSGVLDDAAFVSADPGLVPDQTAKTLSWSGDLTAGTPKKLSYVVRILDPAPATGADHKLKNIVTAPGSNCAKGTTNPNCLLGALTVAEVDYGDAPDTYATGGLSTGPWHSATPGLTLGAGVSKERDARTPLNGLSDTLDDALTAVPHLTRGQTTYKVNVPVKATGPATLAGWVDADGNGQLTDTERATPVPVTADGTVELKWTGLPATVKGASGNFLRLRLYKGTVAGPAPAGAFPGGGEVEDYPIDVKSADLELSSVAVPATAVPGAVIKVTATITGRGPATTVDPTDVKITLPDGVTVAGTAPAGCTAAAGKRSMTCSTTKAFSSGTTAAQDFSVLVDPAVTPGADITGGTASVANPADDVPANDSKPFTVKVGKASADLEVTVASPTAAAVPGESTAVKVKAANKGPSATRTDSTLKIKLPAQTTLGAPLPAGCTAGTDLTDLSCVIGPLGVGKDTEFEIPVQIDPAAPAKTGLEGGTATATNPDATDPDAANNTGIPITIQTADKGRSTLELAVGEPATATPGKTTAVPVTLTNKGPSVTGQETIVTVTLPDKVTAVGTLPAGCTAAADRKSVTCEIAKGLGLNTPQNLTIPVKVDSAASASVTLPGGKVTAEHDAQKLERGFTVSTGAADADISVDVPGAPVTP